MFVQPRTNMSLSQGLAESSNQHTKIAFVGLQGMKNGTQDVAVKTEPHPVLMARDDDEEAQGVVRRLTVASQGRVNIFSTSVAAMNNGAICVGEDEPTPEPEPLPSPDDTDDDDTDLK